MTRTYNLHIRYYMFCPDCHNMWPYDPKIYGRRCSRCDSVHIEHRTLKLSSLIDQIAVTAHPPMCWIRNTRELHKYICARFIKVHSPSYYCLTIFNDRVLQYLDLFTYELIYAESASFPQEWLLS